MFRQREVNPHFLPRNNEPIIEFGPQLSMPPPPHGPRSQSTRTSIDPHHGTIPQLTRTPIDQSHGPGHQLFHTSMEPPHGPMPQLTRTPIYPSHGREHQLFHTSMKPPHGPRPQLTRTSMEPPHGPRQQPTQTSTEPPHSPRHQSARTPIEPTHDPRPKLIRTSIEPPDPRSQPPHSQPKSQIGTPSQHNQESPLHSKPRTISHPHSNRAHRRNHHHRSSLLPARSSRRTKPLAWLVAVFCAIFWIIVIIGGLIILIIYLVFRPKTPRFDINAVTLNAAYLDLGYLLNGDVTVLANFTNPNTKVNVDFSYVIFELHYRNNFIATRYVEPFAVQRRETMFTVVHLVSSQVRLSMADSLELQREMERGIVNLELKGMFRARSKLGGIFRYSYWLNTRCQLMVGSPPNGILIGKRCTTK